MDERILSDVINKCMQRQAQRLATDKERDQLSTEELDAGVSDKERGESPTDEQHSSVDGLHPALVTEGEQQTMGELNTPVRSPLTPLVPAEEHKDQPTDHHHMFRDIAPQHPVDNKDSDYT